MTFIGRNSLYYKVRLKFLEYFCTMIEPMEDQHGLLPVMEQFASLQGEGVNTGRPAWFVRVGGCDVGCSFCDVKESWNPDIHPLTSTDEIVRQAVESGTRSVVITGGEPMLYQLDDLCDKLHAEGMSIFLETSGTEPPSGDFDWICLSPKKGNPVHPFWLHAASELKVIIRCEEDFAFAESMSSKVPMSCMRQLQPEWSVRHNILPIMVRYILKHPTWRLSVQTHKYIKIP